MVLLSIVAACLIATALSITVAFLLDGRGLMRIGESLSAVSTGLLLALACTHLIPEAFEHTESPHTVGITLWAAIFALILLEQLIDLHHHGHKHERPAAARLLVRRVWPIVLGDSLHTFTDGLVIASAFLVSPSLGWAITAGILLHEMPQEIGDFVLIRQQGVERKSAFRMLMLAGASAVAGGVLGYFVMDAVKGALPFALAISGASFLYIALCELIPRLAERACGRAAVLRQAALLASGAAIAFLIGIGH